LRKSTLLALSWAIEDEFCARAERPVLFGAFQDERFYRAAAPRWRELARVARSTMVLGAFTAPDEFPRGGPVPVPLPDDSPIRREWVVACDAPDLSACLAAWELPGQHGTADRDRLFESVWTVDPRAVRDASRVCARAAQSAGVAEAQALLYELAEEPPSVVIDVAAATTMMNRVVAYVDRFSH
jgi:DICT domain-containing protein